MPLVTTVVGKKLLWEIFAEGLYRIGYTLISVPPPKTVKNLFAVIIDIVIS
jgi:hypothetical protein